MGTHRVMFVRVVGMRLVRMVRMRRMGVAGTIAARIAASIARARLCVVVGRVTPVIASFGPSRIKLAVN